jgi:hypothetical protein
MTVAQLLGSADSRELTAWMVLYEIEGAEAERERQKQLAAGGGG